MKILAIDCSSSRASLAILDNQTVVTERTYEENRLRSPRLFPELSALLAQGNLKPDQIDLFAAGTGPGSFSGLRVAIATLCGMALPGGKPIIGVSSAEAITLDVSRRCGRDSVTIVGDARRHRFWVVRYAMAQGRLTSETGFELIAPETLQTHLTPATLLASPDWLRIGSTLHESSCCCTVLEEPVLPCATAVAHIAMQRFQERPDAPEWKHPPSPVYLHPAVAAIGEKA